MRDSPNGKRWGRRDPKGRIIEAYGFDLSPLAARHEEFVRIAEESRAERAEMSRLRRRATIARNGITQILETASECGFEGQEWTRLAEESQALANALKAVERIEEMAIGVEGLERRQREARGRVENLLATAAPDRSASVQTDPKGPEYRPHIYNYKPPEIPEENTDVVIAHGTSSPGGSEALAPSPAPEPQEPAEKAKELKISPDELVRLTPRLRPYLPRSLPAWPDIVEAADWLRHDLGVSKSLWGEACLIMGRAQAAVALAITSAKPEGHIRTSPGGYFHGMVTRAKHGTLNLDRTLWAMRRATAPISVVCGDAQ